MPDVKFEDLIAQVEELDPTLAASFEPFKATALRKKAAESDSYREELDELKAQLASLTKAPARQTAFKDAGIDIESLRPLERKAIESYDGELTAEAIAAYAEENGLPTGTAEGGTDEEEDAEPPAAAAVVAAARTAPQGSGGIPVITQAQVAEWSTQKTIRFMEAHPEEFEALKRGEKVNVAFS